MKPTNGMDRGQFHDKAWALWQANALDDAKLPKLSIHAIRTLWDVLFDSMPKELEVTQPAAQTERTYTTQPGESVMGIALRQCGNEAEWRHILACNPRFADLLPSDYFPVGTVLTLPTAARPASGGESC